MIRPARTLDPRYWWAVLREVTPLRLTLFWQKTEAAARDAAGGLGGA